MCVCSQMIGGERFCRCRRGFEGPRCQHKEVTCGSVSCRNNGTCTRQEAHFRCLCRPGFTGTWCEHEIDECQSSPCRHGKSVISVKKKRNLNVTQNGESVEHNESVRSRKPWYERAWSTPWIGDRFVLGFAANCGRFSPE